jgi:hypothetical protein
MKHILFFTLTLFIGISISACGAAPATPTLSMEQVQGTAAAAAYTVIAQTQASMPTDTAIPPSETLTQTPLPTETLLPTATETLGTPPTISGSPTPASGVSADECNKPLSSFSGPEAYILIANKTGQPIQAWFLVNKTPFGDCGYVTVPPIPAGGDYAFNAPLGCYSAGAWTTGNKKFTIDNVRYPLCANNTDKWTLTVTKDTIFLAPP